MSHRVAETIAPPYGARPPAVVDASLLVAIVFGEPEAAQIEALLGPYELFAPTLLPFEVANAGLNKCRRRILDAAETGARLAAFDFASVRLCAIEPAAVFALAHRYALSTYDASYLWLAGELSVPLFTLDKTLAEAAQNYLQGSAS
ncbi:type II toxin-antitoxin system VapC family toxin [Sulfuricystis multivorans]|uniref:type II toxin-antitoxin system VapC family toxin n=1 Tax=Sulfuricystis multivorans TaxID=2211108 RepID=UPI000F843262|nr:type II toxin-antitoxin system VapC family toxin [Sulfuricystis multivorans]